MISKLDSLYSVCVATINGQQFVVLDGQNWDFVMDWVDTLEGIEVKRLALAQIKERLAARHHGLQTQPDE